MKEEHLIGVLCLVAIYLTGVFSLNNVAEFCENESFNASCPQPDQVLLINKAQYGVILLGRCIPVDKGQTGCVAEVTDYLNLKCAGRRKCEFSQPDAYLVGVDKCEQVFKVHLVVHYECIKVDRAACSTCEGGGKAELSKPLGFISSVVTYETMNDHSCGSSRCPWLVSVQPGQVVNISVYDFSGHPSKNLGPSWNRPRNSDTCPKSMIVKERANPRDVVVCHGGSGRMGKVHVYTSVSNAVEIQVVNAEVFASTHQFLIQYEAVGCPDITPPKNTWIQRKHDKFEVGCSSSDNAIWELTCVDSEWKGVLGSCEGDGPLMGGVLGGFPKAASSLVGFLSSLPFGILLAGVIATATILSVCILTIGYICYKKSHYNHHFKRHPQSLAGDQYMDINDPNCSLVQKVMAGKTMGAKGKGLSTNNRENKYAANHHGRMMMMAGGQMPQGGVAGGVRPLPSIPDLRGTGAATVHRAGGMGGMAVQPPRMMIRSYGDGGGMGIKQRPDSAGYPQQMMGVPRMGDQQQHEYFVIEERNNRADVSNDDSDSFPPPPDLLFPADSRQGSLMRPQNQQQQQFNPPTGNASYRPPMTLSAALKQNNTNTYENQQAILGTLATAGITAAAGGLVLGKNSSEVERSNVVISTPMDI